MATKKPKSQAELLESLHGLDDDLLDPDLPEALVDAELVSRGVDPAALATRVLGRVHAGHEAAPAWQKEARQKLVALEARAAAVRPVVALDRTAILARLEELRGLDAELGASIRLAARKRKPEESTDDELRLLLEEMERLHALSSPER